MGDPRTFVVIVIVAAAIYGGGVVVKAVDSGAHKVAHAVVHVFKK